MPDNRCIKWHSDITAVFLISAWCWRSLSSCLSRILFLKRCFFLKMCFWYMYDFYFFTPHAHRLLSEILLPQVSENTTRSGSNCAALFRLSLETSSKSWEKPTWHVRPHKPGKQRNLIRRESLLGPEQREIWGRWIKHGCRKDVAKTTGKTTSLKKNVQLELISKGHPLITRTGRPRTAGHV